MPLLAKGISLLHQRLPARKAFSAACVHKRSRRSVSFIGVKTLRLESVVLLTLAALWVAAAMGIRSLAQPANPAPDTKPTDVMSGYYEVNRKAILSGTSATNLTEAEVSHLLNESLKTDLVAP